ncbi:winged helix-turn-helix domain-containing protein [Actinoplanes sp. NPDC026670]|uniref:winged helix-turn-helix domain-containing protein n=1 Tax=Actinoplanes sp. NPDC026670 TaxID=3154700 RepID=UPI0033C96C37
MRITDPTAIRALAHPLRLDLLELLATSSPATAAQCGRVLGVSQASCSFHLRQLAKYGFVEDAGPGRDRRERQWRLPDPRPTLRLSPGDNAVVRQQLERMVVDREMQAILEFVGRDDEESTAWRRRAGLTTALALVSDEEAEQLKTQWLALLEPFLARSEADMDARRPGRRFARYFLAATPLPADPADD